MTDRQIRFLLNDRDVVIGDLRPEDLLLDYLRLNAGLPGTKEGCAEGDCGACTVLVGRMKSGKLTYDPVNACIRFLGSLNACHVVTVEHLAGSAGSLHPVQQAMVDNHGSQCGFCTPGIVMSLYKLWMDNSKPSDAEIETALQGNLCRCTGYESVMRAARAMGKTGSVSRDKLVRERKATSAKLRSLASRRTIEIGKGSDRIYVPGDAGDLAAILKKEPKATIVAGSTDAGLWVTKHFRGIGPAIFIGHLDDLAKIKAADGVLRIGATASYTDAAGALARHFPNFGPLINRIGGAQIRAMGTIGGNIANGSPIGDMPPPLIALGASVTLRSSKRSRTMELEKFFVEYGKQDRRKGEFVESVSIPLLNKSVYKISKRNDEDITSALVAIRMRLGREDMVDSIRIACGGMAATPKRANAVEAALRGKPWNENSINAAMDAFAEDFSPLTDMRASAEYRMLVVKNLLRRFYLETQDAGSPSSLSSYVAA